MGTSIILYSMKKIFLLSAPLILTLFVACVTTPETGRSAFILTSEGEETRMGAAAYSEILSK